MKRYNQKPVDKKMFSCPQCGHDMSRPLTHIVSQDKVEHKAKDGTVIALFVDICDKCLGKNYRKYFEPTRSDIRKILKAMKEEAPASDTSSLEDML